MFIFKQILDKCHFFLASYQIYMVQYLRKMVDTNDKDCPHKIIGFGFIVGSVLCAYPNKEENDFTQSLNASQKLKWQSIQTERFHIYLTSIFISLLTISFFKSLSFWVKWVIMMVLTVSIYLITPKKAYMAEYLTSNEQHALLRKIYRKQQVRYYGSLTFAIMSAPFVCRSYY